MTTHILLGNDDFVKRIEIYHTDPSFADTIASSVHYFYKYESLVYTFKHDVYIMIDVSAKDDDFNKYIDNCENVASLISYLEYMCPNSSIYNDKHNSTKIKW